MMRRLATLAAASLLAACAHAPDTSTPVAGLPEAYDTQPQTSATLQERWWTLYGDATLSALVDAALAGNLDLRIAAARVEENVALLRQTSAVQWPEVDLQASASRSRSSTLNAVPVSVPTTTTQRVALATSFEIDLWGRLRNATAAAQDQLLASQAARDAVRLALTASVAQTYFALRALDAQVALAERAVKIRSDSLALIERRAAGGVASPLEVAQARSALAAAAALAPDLRRQRALLEHQLALTLGVPGRRVDAAADPLVQATPAVPPPGLPSTLLQRRPDIHQAEAQLRASRAQVEVVRAAMFPSVTLTASVGGQSAELSDLAKSGARIWSIGPSLLLPLLDSGRNTARTDQARAQAEQAALAYQKAVQTAFRETADALTGVEEGTQQELQADRLVAAARESLRIAERRYEAGYAGYLDVLDAQRGAQDAEQSLVRARQLRLDASVALFKALGGGWQRAQ
jgi:multidrug efflux system outer membrane protein